MPTYEYVCEQCGSFEQFQKMMDTPLSVCPKCGGPVKRVIGPGAGIIFKGSGFYSTDYRKPEYEKRAKEESGKGEEKKEGTSSEGEQKKDTSAKAEDGKAVNVDGDAKKP